MKKYDVFISDSLHHAQRWSSANDIFVHHICDINLCVESHDCIIMLFDFYFIPHYKTWHIKLSSTPIFLHWICNRNIKNYSSINSNRERMTVFFTLCTHNCDIWSNDHPLDIFVDQSCFLSNISIQGSLDIRLLIINLIWKCLWDFRIHLANWTHDEIVASLLFWPVHSWESVIGFDFGL